VSLLRNIERTIGGLFEGVFSRTFRSTVQPVELARKLAKEMNDHKTISIHRVYVPDEYTIYLNPADREQFSAYETQMRNELAEYLVEHARREGYTLSARPLVLLETDEDLTVVFESGDGNEGPQGCQGDAREGTFPFDDVQIAKENLASLGYRASVPEGAPVA